MLKNLRRLTRKNLFLPVTISVENVNTGAVLTDALTGHITNLTKHGACLFMEKIMMGSFHFFHSTKENDSLVLQLTITMPHEGECHTITARPLWFDIFRDEQRRGFKIGIEFTQPPSKEFFHAL